MGRTRDCSVIRNTMEKRQFDRPIRLTGQRRRRGAAGEGVDRGFVSAETIGHTVGWKLRPDRLETRVVQRREACRRGLDCVYRVVEIARNHPRQSSRSPPIASSVLPNESSPIGNSRPPFRLVTTRADDPYRLLSYVSSIGSRESPAYNDR